MKNVDWGYRLFGGGGCNGVTQTIVITMYAGVIYTVSLIGVLLYPIREAVIPYLIDYG